MKNSFARTALTAAAAATLLAACSSIDCPLNNRVYARYRLAGTVTHLADTMTISTNRSDDGSDTVLINMQAPTDSFSLPVSYHAGTDIFYIELRDTAGQHYTDTLEIEKTNEPHFESVDCSANYFHTLTAVTCTHNAVDSVRIINNKVDYDNSKTHFLIYFRPHY